MPKPLRRLEAGHEVAREVARLLALWMCYGDVIQVASLKARVSRLERIRGEVRARAGDVVRVYDLFQPSVLEIAAILPRRLGAWLEQRAGGRGKRRLGGKGIALQASSLSGALALRLAAALRSLRPTRCASRVSRRRSTIGSRSSAKRLPREGPTSIGRSNWRGCHGCAKATAKHMPAASTDFQHILDAHRAGNSNDPDGATAALRVAVQAALEKSSVPHAAVASLTARAQPVFWSKASTR